MPFLLARLAVGPAAFQPRELAASRLVHGRRVVDQDVGQPGRVGGIGAGVMQRARVVHRAAARRQRLGHGQIAGEVAAAFQRVQMLVAAGRAMLQHVPFVGPGDELHAAVLQRGRLQRQPDAQLLVDEVGRAEGLVLVPGRLGPAPARLEQRVLAIQRRVRPQQLARHRQGAGVVRRLQQVGGIMARIVQAGKPRRPGRIVPADEVVLRALVVARPVLEHVHQRGAYVAHFVLRADAVQGQVALLSVTRCLCFRQQTGLFHNGLSKLVHEWVCGGSCIDIQGGRADAAWPRPGRRAICLTHALTYRFDARRPIDHPH